MSDIVFKGSYRPLSEIEICDFEKWLGSRLPPKYRQFLLRTNGGHPHKRMLPYCYVQGFNSITSNKNVSLVSDIEAMADELPIGLIPIAYGGAGERLCLSLSDDKIYLWEHKRDYGHRRARLVQLTMLADNIEKLLDNLEGDSPPVPDEEIVNLGRWGDVNLLDEYLSKGHDINAVTMDGRTLALGAVYEGHFQFLKECVRRGALIDNQGLLHAAMFKMNREIVQYLLEQGVDPNEKNESGMTPLDKARSPSTGSAAQLLKNHGGVNGQQTP